jgi:hypothetical protein
VGFGFPQPVQREQRAEFVAIETEGGCFVTDLRGWLGRAGWSRRQRIGLVSVMKVLSAVATASGCSIDE